MKHLKNIVAIVFISSVTFGLQAGFQDDQGGEIDIFSVFDTNHDGKISMEEMTVGMFNMIKTDSNGDHYLSREELQNKENYSHFMAMFDFNQDGKLSEGEIPPMHMKMLRKMDKNRDGYLTIDELTGEKDTW